LPGPTFKWTAARPLPDFLQFPAAELLLLNLLALPAAMYSMLLMVQAPFATKRMLGVAVFLLVLGYLLLISWLLLFIVRHKKVLGLCVPDSEAGSSIGGSSNNLQSSGSKSCKLAEPVLGPNAAGHGSFKHPKGDLSDSALDSSSSHSLPSSAAPLLPTLATDIVHHSDQRSDSTDTNTSSMQQGPDLQVLVEQRLGLSERSSSSDSTDKRSFMWWGSAGSSTAASGRSFWSSRSAIGATLDHGNRSRSKAWPLRSFRSSRAGSAARWQLAHADMLAALQAGGKSPSRGHCVL
jgi:hypothetical protein